MKKRVLFLCTGNSARSQMAEAFLRQMAPGEYEAFSAGTEPRGLHLLAVRVMAEVGIDISRQRSKPLDVYLHEPFDYVITVCDRAREHCPIFPTARNQMHWGFDDPVEAQGSEEERLQVFRRVRDEIHEQLRRFLSTQQAAHD